jgi:hypothetical protein
VVSSFRFSDSNFVRISHFLHACCMLRSYNSLEIIHDDDDDDDDGDGLIILIIC